MGNAGTVGHMAGGLKTHGVTLGGSLEDEVTDKTFARKP